MIRLAVFYPASSYSVSVAALHWPMTLLELVIVGSSIRLLRASIHVRLHGISESGVCMIAIGTPFSAARKQGTAQEVSVAAADASAHGRSLTVRRGRTEVGHVSRGWEGSARLQWATAGSERRRSTHVQRFAARRFNGSSSSSSSSSSILNR